MNDFDQSLPIPVIIFLVIFAFFFLLPLFCICYAICFRLRNGYNPFNQANRVNHNAPVVVTSSRYTPSIVYGSFESAGNLHPTTYTSPQQYPHTVVSTSSSQLQYTLKEEGMEVPPSIGYSIPTISAGYPIDGRDPPPYDYVIDRKIDIS